MANKVEVSIKDFGAVSNNHLQTEKIQTAIDYCYLNGGGEVYIPEGIFLTGGIRLRSNVTLHLQKNAVLKGSRNPEDYFGYLNDIIEPLKVEYITDAPYVHLSTIKGETEYDPSKKEYDFKRKPGSRWLNALIRAIDAENISIIGEEGSFIDGSNCYDQMGEEGYRGPHLLTFYYCENIILDGYTMRDSANWAHNMLYCDNITVNGITVLAGHDGFDAAVCNNIKIVNSNFYTGDDCIAGFANNNVIVENCELNSACSALRFGGTNVLIRKCHIYGPCRYLFRGNLTMKEKKNGTKPPLEWHRNNMLSAFTYYADYSLPIEQEPGNIVISDCNIENADRFLHYNYYGNETWQKNRSLKNIRFENIKATGISMPLTAYGDENNPVTVDFNDVNVTFKDGFEDITFMHVSNYERITLDNVSIINNNSKPLIKTWSDGKLEINNLICDINEENYVLRAEEDFNCRPI